MRCIALLIVPLLLASPSFAAQKWPMRPNHKLTPGVARDLTVTKICNTKWGSDARSVTAKMKRDVMASYHFTPSVCPLTAFKGKRVHRAEIDHLVPRSLGGADTVKNLWPQCYEPVKKDKGKQLNGAHKKDRLEIELHARVCRARSATLLKHYRRKFRTNWLALYREIYGNK